MSYVVNLIENEIKSCRYKYFDVLEVASGQVNCEHLRDYLFKNGFTACLLSDDTLVEAARTICKETLDQTAKLQSDMFNNRLDRKISFYMELVSIKTDVYLALVRREF